MVWEFPSKVMEDIPEIPSRGLPWKKVYGLIGLAGVGLGTAVGTTAWGGVENGNKNAVLVQNASLEVQKASLDSQIKELQTQAEQKDAEVQRQRQELEKKEGSISKLQDDNRRIAVETRQNIYRNSGQVGQDLQLQDIRLGLKEIRKDLYFINPCDWKGVCRRRK